MTKQMQDTILSTLLLVLAGVWIWLVATSIPGGFGRGDIGPRAFPLSFGIALAVLSGGLLLRSILVRFDGRFEAIEEEDTQQKIHWIPALLVLVQISLYGFLMQTCGFVIATPIIIVMIMLINLRERSIKKILAMALGITVGSWAVFEKLLGIYLANGTWINLG
ncbi:hypothetical protein A8B78_14900 [Jannaschia sp. EhC01]|nr:hypothetical protein A8B78_14900 [Jannaschia sp. EhC01]